MDGWNTSSIGTLFVTAAIRVKTEHFCKVFRLLGNCGSQSENQFGRLDYSSTARLPLEQPSSEWSGIPCRQPAILTGSLSLQLVKLSDHIGCVTETGEFTDRIQLQIGFPQQCLDMIDPDMSDQFQG